MNETGGGLQDWVDKKSQTHRPAGYLVYLVLCTWLPCLNQNGSEPVNENGGQQELVKSLCNSDSPVWFTCEALITQHTQSHWGEKPV